MKAFTATLAFILICSPLLRAKNNKSPAQLHFLENKGQVTDQYHNQRTDINFKISSGALNVFIGTGKLHYQFHKPGLAAISKNITTDAGPIPMYRMDVVLQNANKNAQIITEDNQPYYEQHYRSVTPVTAHSFRKITYKNIYPSIDWVLYIKDNQLEYDFVIHKDGNPAEIKLQYNGATSLALNKDGGLTANTPMGTVTEHAPYSYQEDGAQVASSFSMNGNTVSFKTAAHKGELTIDPAVVWGTYYGGVMNDEAYSIDHDNTGNIFIAGKSSSINEIATVGSHQSTMISAGMAFLVKFNSAGVRQWGTYFGGNIGEDAQDISIDGAGNIFMVGGAYSSTGVATPGSHQETMNSTIDGFLAKFNNSGALQWATYFGGDTTDILRSVANDNAGNVFIVGYTSSANNIATVGSFQPIMTGENDAFLAKFDGNGTLQWSTYYGDLMATDISDLCVDVNGNVYFTGTTTATANIATPGSHQETPGGDLDIYLVKFNNDGQRIWGTYYGGSQYEQIGNIVYDGFGHIYLGAMTMSTNNIATPGSHQPTLSVISNDVFLAKLDTNGVRIWGTYYGHWGNESLGGLNGGRGIATDDSGNAFIVGSTTSDSSIATMCTHQQFRAGGIDNFIAKFDSLGSRRWGTYYGGSSLDGGSSSTYYDGSIYLSGVTESNSGIATPGSHDEVYSSGSGSDGFLMRLADCEIPEQPAGITGLTTVCEGDTVIYSTGAICQATSHTWTLPNGWTGTSSVDSIIAIAGANSGNVTVSANSACGISSAQTLAVTVNPSPVPIISISGNLLSTGNYTTYQWNLDGSQVAGATSQTYQYTQPGQYTVTITDANGCSGTSAPFSTSVNTISHQRSITLYPNPNNGSFTLSLTGLINNEEVLLLITDITGRTIHTFTEPTNKGSLQRNISIDKSLPAGQYFLKVSSGELNKVLMFTKL